MYFVPKYYVEHYDFGIAMGRNLKGNEVIDIITRKVELKKALRNAKLKEDNDQIKVISKKMKKLDTDLHSRPLSKT